jgi:hypothetical protein
VKVKRKSSKETRKETRRTRTRSREGKNRKQNASFSEEKSFKKTYLAYTRGCHISETTSKQQNFLQQKQKFCSNLSFFFKNLSSRKGLSRRSK